MSNRPDRKKVIFLALETIRQGFLTSNGMTPERDYDYEHVVAPYSKPNHPWGRWRRVIGVDGRETSGFTPWEFLASYPTREAALDKARSQAERYHMHIVRDDDAVEVK